MRKYRFCILEIIIGVLMVALGVVTIVKPEEVIGAFTLCYAVMAIISGMRDIIFYCKCGRYTGARSVLSLVTSIIGIMAGIILFIYPSAGTIIVSLILPLWFISHSIFQLASLDIIRMFMTKHHYMIALIAGILGLILGIITLFHPLVSVRVVTFTVSVYLIISGIVSIIIGVSRLELEV